MPSLTTTCSGIAYGSSSMVIPKLDWIVGVTLSSTANERCIKISQEVTTFVLIWKQVAELHEQLTGVPWRNKRQCGKTFHQDLEV